VLPHRDGRRGEIWVGEVADGNGDVSKKAFALPVDGGAACRTEIKGQRVATFGCPHPRRRPTGEGDLLAAEARLVADRGASAALALQAVAHRDARWLALNRKVKLPATAGGVSGGHEPAPWLSIWRSVGWTSKRCTMASGIGRCAGWSLPRDGDIRSHFAAHLAVLEKWSKVRVDGGVQSVMRPRRQCGEGWGERSCCEGSGPLSDPALENQWQSCAPNTDLVKTRSLDRVLEDLSIRPTEWCQQPVC